MSAYSTNTTQFKDCQLLLQALAEMGFDSSTVEVHDKPQPLIDYHGRPTHYVDETGDKAEVIIRRQFVGVAANDIGFRKTSNGTYEAMISAFDRSGNGYNSQWLGKLSASYARHGIIQKATTKGLKYGGSVKKNGKTQLIFTQA